MNILNLIIIAACLLITGAGFYWLRSRKRVESRSGALRSAIQACETLLQLIACIQQHRGMSTALLAGDHSFERRLFNKRAEITPLLQQLQLTATEENANAYPCFTPNDVALWRHRWDTLLLELTHHSIEKSIAVHGSLIASLLNWLDALGEARIELPMGNALPAGAVRNYAHRLPQLTECLGQARATGSGVAARGSCSAVARVRLMFLVSRAETLVDQACGVDSGGTAAAQKVRALASLIRSQMLASQRVEVTAEHYYSEATHAIDAVFEWIRHTGQHISQQLDTAATVAGQSTQASR